MSDLSEQLFIKMTPAEEADLSVVPVEVNWNKVIQKNKTTITTHAWYAPQLRREQPFHDNIFKVLKNFNVSHLRFQSWFPHPKLAVPELEPPTKTKTSWDFSKLDPFVEDCMKCSGGKPVVANLSTIPTWMFKVENSVKYPDDPETIFWQYEQGTELRDPSMKEVADYFYRIASWYIKGGFKDELGVYHKSGHHYKFDYWEVLCEPNLGHRLSPETYTKIYDAIVERLQDLDPDMKFIGLSIALLGKDHDYFWYFLDEKNHKPNISINAISYHFYAHADLNNVFVLEDNAPFSEWRGIFYAQADGLLVRTNYIKSICKHIAPQVEIHVNEIGTFSPDIMNPNTEIPQEYWVLSASLFAYIWSGLVNIGVEVAGISEIFDWPGMCAGTTLVDWKTGEPNERYWVAKMLVENFKPGDSVVSSYAGRTGIGFMRIHAKAFVNTKGMKKLLLINKYKEPIKVTLPLKKASIMYVDTSTGRKTASTIRVHDGKYMLGPYATAVVVFN